MKTQTEKQKAQALIRQNISNTGKARSQLYQFTDHRLETATHERLQQMAGSSPKAKGIAQLQTMADHGTPDRTGLPNDLKVGIENLSGYVMDDVRVHYNSDKPAKLYAHAFAQGTAIHIAPGQEKHLPHEAWHVVQQKQGRVKPTTQLKGDTTKPDGVDQNRENVVQRVLHKGKTKKSQVYVNAVKLGDYSTEEVRSFIDSDEHYMYDKATKKIVKIPSKKGKKRKRTSSNVGEMKGWMAEVDQGVEQHKKTDGSNIVFKARKMKDEGKEGFNVGINNIADFGDMETTAEVSMTDTQKPLNFFANFVRNAVIDEGAIADDEKEEDDKEKEIRLEKRKKRKKQFGPELQQIVGKKDGSLHIHFGGNTQQAQEMLRDELGAPPNKKRKLLDYHRSKYRAKTVAQAIEQMKRVLKANTSISSKLEESINSDKSNKEISEMLKSAIGNRYKTRLLAHLYTLRNCLRTQYPDGGRLEDAIITVPDNLAEIHAESNLLDKTIKDLEILDVMGTKVPCVACFAKFCQQNQQAHLLQYTSSIWFSKPCMNQLGCDYDQQSAVEVLKYLNTIDQNLKQRIANIKRYTGYMGDIKQEYHDSDSESMGEESRQAIIDEYRGK